MLKYRILQYSNPNFYIFIYKVHLKFIISAMHMSSEIFSLHYTEALQVNIINDICHNEGRITFK